MTTSNISSHTILKLETIFRELGWEKDSIFDRFCQTLEFLDKEQQELFLELTKKFLRIDLAKYFVYLKKALLKIDQDLLKDIKTIYVVPLIAKKDLGKSKSSIMISRLLTGRELMAKDILHVENVVSLDRLRNLQAISGDKSWLLLVVDDFIGTGETADTTLTEYVSDSGIDTGRIIVLSLVAQQIGNRRITSKGIKLVCAELRKRGISDEYPSPLKEDYISIMSSIEKMMHVQKQFCLGYMASESLVTLDRTPNNTFPIYWFENKIKGRKFIAPFPRY